MGNDDFMQAICNGRPILTRTNSQTVIPPDCGASYKLQCDPSRQVPRGDVGWVLGLNFAGYGSDYRKLGRTSPFAPLPSGGIEIRMRNIYIGRPRQ